MLRQPVNIRLDNSKGSKYFKNPEQEDKSYLPVEPLRLWDAGGGGCQLSRCPTEAFRWQPSKEKQGLGGPSSSELWMKQLHT